MAATTTDPVEVVLLEGKEGEVRFFIYALPAMAGWDLAEGVRYELGKIDLAVGNIGGGDEEATTSSVIETGTKILTGLSPAFVLQVRNSLFEHVWFHRTSDPGDGRAKLAGLESSAFADAGPGGVYAILLRAFMEHFVPLWQHLQSLVPGLLSMMPGNQPEAG